MSEEKKEESNESISEGTWKAYSRYREKLNRNNIDKWFWEIW